MHFKNSYPFILTVFILLFGPFISGTFAKVSPDEPKLFSDETTFSFGEVHEGEEVRHHFLIQNTGTSPLMILDVKTD